jgi:hypothetical protein
MKDNSNGFIRGTIIFILVVFLILLVKNTRTREGLDTLNVGKWKLGGTTGQLDFQTTETDKKVIFNAPLSVKSGNSNLNIGIATADKGAMKTGDTTIISDKGLFIGSAEGKGIRIESDGTLSVKNGLNVYANPADKNYAIINYFGSDGNRKWSAGNEGSVNTNSTNSTNSFIIYDTSNPTRGANIGYGKSNWGYV